MDTNNNNYIAAVNRESNTLILRIYTITMIVGIFSFTALQFISGNDSRHNLKSIITINLLFVIFLAIPNMCRTLKVKEKIITHILSILFILIYAVLVYYTSFTGAKTVWVMGVLLLIIGAFYLTRIVLIYASIGSLTVLSILLIVHPIQSVTIHLADHIGRFIIVLVMIFVAFKANSQYARMLKENFEQYGKIQETNKKLKESEEKFRGIFELSPGAIVITSIDEGVILDCNRTFLEYFGYRKEEVIGKTSVELHLWISSKQREASLERLEKSGSRSNLEIDIKTKGGEIRHFIMSGEIIAIDGVNRILTALFDITEKKKAEEELIALKNELEKRVDLRTEELQIALEEVRASNEELLEAGEVIKQKNIELEENYGKLVETQKQLVQKEKMAGIGLLAAGVAHEINNPLGFIISNAETLKGYIKRLSELIKNYRDLKNHIDSAWSDKTAEIINAIESYEKTSKIDFILEDVEELFSDTSNGLDRVKSIVSALRKFSHIDRSDEMEEYDLNEGINTTLIIANNEIKHIAAVEKNLADIPKIHAIGGEVSQVILNILINAAHAIKSKAVVHGKILISTYLKDNYVFCDIEDNGIGMNKQTLNRIFEPFYTTKSVGEGTGLGLSLAYDVIVKKHQGRIFAESKPGIGTRFTIMLPINNSTQVKGLTI